MVAENGSEAGSTSVATSVAPTIQGSENGDEPPKDLPKERIHRGYKNVPSLDAITERLRARNISDGSATSSTGPSLSSLSVQPAAHDEIPAASVTGPSDVETVVEPPTAVVTTSETGVEEPELHPLQYTWTLFHDSRSTFLATPSAETSHAQQIDSVTGGTNSYGAGLSVVGEFETVENFCRYFNWLKPPSQLEAGSNYHLFKSGIKPMWEDAANANVSSNYPS